MKNSEEEINNTEDFESVPLGEDNDMAPEGEEMLEGAEASLEEDLMKMREAALRTAAEYDNYRKRVAKEKEDIIRYANQRLLEELLPVLDHFEMGMVAAKADESSMIYIGMSMVQKQLEDFLANQGVSKVPTEGSFDHNIHDAVGKEEVDNDQQEHLILRVVRPGYTLKDKLIRPASVIVSCHKGECAEG